MTGREATARVDAATAGLRLDQAVSRLFPGVTRGRAREAIGDGRVFVDDRRVGQNSYPVREGASIRLAAKPRAVATAEPRIVFEDDAIVVVDKPAGMPVEPTREGARGTLVDWFRARGATVGVVHRLDQAVSGLLVLAKKPLALKILNEAMRERRVARRYRARVEGRVAEDERTIDTPLLHRGKERSAVTRVRVVERSDDSTLLIVEIETGRTHQIRRHLAAIGHPVLGDKKYGAHAAYQGDGAIALAAIELAFAHPRSHEPMSFSLHDVRP